MAWIISIAADLSSIPSILYVTLSTPVVAQKLKEDESYIGTYVYLTVHNGTF